MNLLRKTFVMMLFSLIGVGVVIAMFGFRINTSDSIPKGVYWINGSTALTNAYVIFCPDNREAFLEGLQRGYLTPGPCSNQSGYLMKKVVAVSGDKVSSTKEGVRVNGHLLPFSKPKLQDGLHRILPQWRTAHYQLKPNEVLTMTNQDEWSFDGRYYGVIKKGQIKGVLTPVWVNRLKVAKS